MPRILFRADAEKSIGVGDLMSLIYLSHEFKKHLWDCFFAVRNYEPALNILQKRNMNNVELIPPDTTIQKEIRIIKALCRKYSIDCLFMEITKNSLHEYRSLGKPTRVKACVNFDGVITDDFDVVVNWCIDSSDNIYKDYEGKDIHFILGFENTILPDYFDWERISRREFNKNVEKILISMGGVDEYNLTGRIVTALSQRKNDFEIRVITGPGYVHGDELFLLRRGAFKSAALKHNVNNVLDDYLWAEVVFSAGGLTSSELVATKTPAILVATCEHQVKRCEYYAQKGWAYYGGYHKDFDKKAVVESLEYVIGNINTFRESLYTSYFKGGNEKIFKTINSC